MKWIMCDPAFHHIHNKRLFLLDYRSLQMSTTCIWIMIMFGNFIPVTKFSFLSPFVPLKYSYLVLLCFSFLSKISCVVSCFDLMLRLNISPENLAISKGGIKWHSTLQFTWQSTDFQQHYRPVIRAESNSFTAVNHENEQYQRTVHVVNEIMSWWNNY